MSPRETGCPRHRFPFIFDILNPTGQAMRPFRFSDKASPIRELVFERRCGIIDNEEIFFFIPSKVLT